jgi:hypothetical protein
VRATTAGRRLACGLAPRRRDPLGARVERRGAAAAVAVRSARHRQSSARRSRSFAGRADVPPLYPAAPGHTTVQSIFAMLVCADAIV